MVNRDSASTPLSLNLSACAVPAPQRGRQGYTQAGASNGANEKSSQFLWRERNPAYRGRNPPLRAVGSHRLGGEVSGTSTEVLWTYPEVPWTYPEVPWASPEVSWASPEVLWTYPEVPWTSPEVPWAYPRVP